MGSGAWDTNVYKGRAAARPAGQSAFTHDSAIRSGKVQAGAHDDLDPKKLNGPASPLAGKNIRESRDSDDHPTSTPVAVLFDETGSMGIVPRELQKKLPQLLGVLTRKGYVEHPQIMFGAIGDAYTDSTPLQVGQFESDNRMDDDLEHIYLEGNGGGQVRESYELALYYMARHTAHDAWEKRGRKGYLFIIGDEGVYTSVNPAHVQQFIAPVDPETKQPMQLLDEPVSVEDIVREVQERYEVFLIRPASSYGMDHPIPGTTIGQQWKALLGSERVIDGVETDAVCETIALTIGLLEGTTDLDSGAQDLLDMGSDAGAVRSASKALATVSAGGSTLAVAEGGSLDLSGDDGTERL